jgi:predicted amidohydrolase YtcJ
MIDRRAFTKLIAGTACSYPLRAIAARTELDLALENGRFWTGAGDSTTIDAVGIAHGRIVALGHERVRALSGRGTRRVDLKGAFGMPAFADAHTHFLVGSEVLGQPDLLGASDQATFAQRIGAAASANPGRWILGGTWDEQRMGGKLPTRAWIDAVTPDTPVAVPRTDLHSLLLNSVALRLANITATTPDPAGGVIVRDGDGNPTGILKDNAKGLVERIIPSASDAQIDETLRRGIRYALSKGVAQIHNPEIHWQVFHSLRRLRTSGETGVRFRAFIPIADWQKLVQIVAEEGTGDDWVRWGGVKALADGSLGSRTAKFYEPYSDAPGETGIWIIEPDKLRELVGEADSHGLQVAVHAIGDKAIDSTLDIFDAVTTAHGARDRRFRMEHAQHIRPASIGRFVRQGVIASMQPYHAIDDGRWAVKRIGTGRLSGTYGFRSLIDSGAHVAFGSDWPVAPLDPLTGLSAAVLRQTIDGQNPSGWLPEQRTSVLQALTAYTAGVAYAGYMESRTGRLAENYYADIAILDTDLLRTDSARLSSAKVLHTYVGGELRFTAG